MIVNSKMVQYDLSRFRGSKIRTAALCDIMRIPDFLVAVNQQNESPISDRWIADTAEKIKEGLRTGPELRSVLSREEINQRRRYFRLAKSVVRACAAQGLYEK